MLEWNAAARAGFLFSISDDGKKIKDWVEDRYYQQLDKCFSNWNQDSGISALEACLNLFEEVAKETALLLQFSINESVSAGIRQFVKQLIPFSHGEANIKD